MAEARPGTPADGRVRAVIDAVRPCVDRGRFAVKRITGDAVEVEADCFADGHDALRARLRWRAEGEAEWREAEMSPLANDRWRGSFAAGPPGRYRFAVCAWVDHFQSWRNEFARREDPEDICVAALAGAELIAALAGHAKGAERKRQREGRPDPDLASDRRGLLAARPPLALPQRSERGAWWANCRFAGTQPPGRGAQASWPRIASIRISATPRLILAAASRKRRVFSR